MTARGEARLAAWVGVVLLVVGLAVAPPWADPGELPAGFAARMLAGELERETASGWVAVREGELVAEGSRVRTGEGAALAVTGGRITLALETVATLDEPTTLEAGALLTEVAELDRAVRLGGVLATGRGTWRLDAGPNQRVAVYAGGLGLRAEGSEGDQAIAVRRYEQVELVAGRIGDGPLPLRYRSDDLWDARLLAGALAVDREVDRLERGLTLTYGSDAQDRGFYADFAVVEETHLDAVPPAMFETAPAAQMLIHLTVVRLIADRTLLGPQEAADEVLDLRRDGATWGLVLMRHGLDVEDLRGAVDLALVDAPPAPEPAPEPEPAPAEDPAPEPDPGPEPATTPPPPPPPGEDEDEDDGGLVDEVGGVVEDTVEDLDDLVDEVTDPLPLPDLGGLTRPRLP